MCGTVIVSYDQVEPKLPASLRSVSKEFRKVPKSFSASKISFFFETPRRWLAPRETWGNVSAVWLQNRCEERVTESAKYSRGSKKSP